MDKYNAILNKLQHTAPIVTDPEGLTQRIMKEIEQPVIRTGRLTDNKNRGNKSSAR